MQETREVAERIERARGGDREAFDELVRAHSAQVYRMLFRQVGNHEDAEDLTQECFVRAWSSLAWYREQGSFGGWLHRIALHLARDHFRGTQRRPRLTGSGSPDPGLDALPLPDAHAPGEALGRRELGARVADALQRLPVRLRSALVLRVFEGLDYEEVGRATGVTPATSRTHVMQARRQLLRWLGPWLEGGRR